MFCYADFSILIRLSGRRLLCWRLWGESTGFYFYSTENSKF